MFHVRVPAGHHCLITGCFLKPKNAPQYCIQDNYCIAVIWLQNQPLPQKITLGCTWQSCPCCPGQILMAVTRVTGYCHICQPSHSTPAKQWTKWLLCHKMPIFFVIKWVLNASYFSSQQEWPKWYYKAQPNPLLGGSLEIWSTSKLRLSSWHV